jgi:Rhodopirellula transposase DDE domain
MAYDEGLATRIREAIGDRPGLAEQQMFGGLAFLVHGNGEPASLVGDDGQGAVPDGWAAAGHRRRGRVQRVPDPGVEDRAGRVRGRDRPPGDGVPLPAGHLQVEQDRTPAVQPHLDELARAPADLPRGDRRDTTDPGLRVHAELDRGRYPLGVKVSDRELAAVPLRRHDWHGEWNYTVLPAAA